MMQRLWLSRLHYGWVIAAIIFVALLGVSGFRAALNQQSDPLQDEFGWSRTPFALATFIGSVMVACMGPFTAAMGERWGPRRVTTAALLTLAAVALLTTRLTAAWQVVLLWGVVVGLGGGAMSIVLVAAVVNRWFLARRGLALALLMTPGVVGLYTLSPIFASVATHLGWHAVSYTMAGVAIAIVPLLRVFLRHRPADLGLPRYGAATIDAPSPSPGNPIATAVAGLRLAVGSRDFRLLVITFVVFGAVTDGLIGNRLVAVAMEYGGEDTAEKVFAFSSLFFVVGTIASGWLTDRYDSRYLLFACYGLLRLTLILLPWAIESPRVGLRALVVCYILTWVFYALTWSAAIPPTVALTTSIFGQARAGIVFGWIFAAYRIGGLTSYYVVCALRNDLRDNPSRFMVAGGVCLLAAGLSLQIGRARSSYGAPRLAPLEEAA